MDIRGWISLALFALLVVFAVKTYGDFYPKEKVPFNWPHFIARVAIFGAIAIILYIVPVFQIKLFFMPSFLELHFDEIPVFIAGFAYGPLTAFAILVLKTLVKLPFSSTLMVGELGDFIYSTAFVIPAVWIYQKKRNMKGVALGFGVSTITHLVVTSIVNVLWILPFYMTLYGMDEAALLKICQVAIPALQDLKWSYVFYVNVPFNLIKDVCVIVVTFLVYRSIHKLLHYDKPQLAKK